MYGQVNLSVDRVNDGAVKSNTNYALTNNSSRLGVKGSEDIGGGLTAMFQAEGIVAATGKSAAFSFDRNTFIGVSSADLGTALVGRHDTPYKIATRGLDLFADINAADNRKLMGNGVHDARLNNAVAYISPSMGGLTVAAATALGADSAVAGPNKKGKAFSLAGMYGMDGLNASLSYQKITVGTGGSGSLGNTDLLGATTVAGDSTKAIKLGASYAIDAFKVNAVVEKVTLTTGTPAVDAKNTNLYLGGKYSLSATDAVKLAYTKRGDTTGNTDNVKQVSLGYDHDMSKRTSVYALYTKVTDNGDNGVLGAGNIKNADPSTISVGMKHAF
jgi:predicted porin